jgi:hypothetical protein
VGYVIEQTLVTDISEETWRSVIAGLSAAGWSVQIGGGLDFSWALLAFDEMRIDMEYDIWREGEMTFATVHGPKIKGALSTDLLAQFDRG